MSSATSAYYYRSVGFRSGVEHVLGDTRAVFTYDLTSFDVEMNEAAANEIERLCTDLRTGLPADQIAGRYPAFAPFVWDLLEAFDRYGFITEVAKDEDRHAVPGSAFWRQIEAFSNRAKIRFRPVLYQALLARDVSRQSLVRYALEYFHLVCAGPRIIAGSLPHENNGATRDLLETFLRQEVGHDQLLLQSLAAVGVSESQARESLPLPETFALIAGLQTLADQEPLSFKALVFLLETANSEFHRAFVDACSEVGLDEAFWAPIVLHAGINEDGDHGSISERLLDQVELVSAEERNVVLKQVATLIESLIAFERAILAAGEASDGA